MKLAVEQGAIYCKLNGTLGVLIMLMIKSHEHVPSHEQVAFIRLKRAIVTICGLESLLNLSWNTQAGFTEKSRRRIKI